MAIEHSCHACGAALGRIRATPDPIYNLPVVVCPACTTARTCRRHPHDTLRRAALRLRAALGAIGINLFLAALLIGVTYLVSWMMVDSLHGVRALDLLRHVAGLHPIPDQIDVWREDRGTALLIIWIVWSIALGAAATAALPHNPRWLVWSLLLLVLALAPLPVMLVRWAIEVPSHPGYWSRPQVFAMYWRRAIPVMEFIALGLALAPLGIPFGRSFRRAAAQRSRRRWKKSLARARKRRSAA